MARLFPLRSDTATEEGQPRVVDLEGEDADAVFGALSSTTAREIYSRLDDEPGTPSDIADAIDSSIQNVRYHLEKLEDAGLVEVVDTWYSSRGNEMSVYATTDGPLIVTSDESRASRLKEALSRLVGGIGALAGGSLFIQYAMTRWLAPAETGPTANGGAQPAGSDSGRDNGTIQGTDDAGDADSSDGSVEQRESDDIDTADAESTNDAATDSTTDGDSATTESADDSAAMDGADESGAVDSVEDSGAVDPANDSGGTDSGLDPDNETLQNVTDGGAEAIETVFGTVPPGLLFFLGGLVVLLAITIYWYWYRPAY
ncbi:ArsR/SmtB family transcription factor [Natrinema altunense]|uniref:Regulatory protein ArsR n=1 Tax=Natrinema altunense (strain JCM 12890 / CGMCC 1.3731 / AJ2) TaxID=1227494 RepID=L9ZFX7_NATA2|nr:helix-turn-helix domain-containing protein [Natrinema altunense]ELY84078.1 regulatory protein ArsR [Natrinema altunense JCM 12890]